MPIGIGIGVAGGLGAAGSIFGGMMQSDSAKKALKAYIQMTNQAMARSQAGTRSAIDYYKPFGQSGKDSLAALAYLLYGSPSAQGAALGAAGINPGDLAQRYNWDQYTQDAGLPTGTTQAQYLQNPSADQFAKQNNLTDNPAGWLADQLAAPTGFQQSPGYQWQLDQGMKAATNSQAARGMGLSGAAMKELNNYAQGQANQDYGAWWNRQMALKNQNLGQYNTWANQTANNNALNLSNFYNSANLNNQQKQTLYSNLFGMLNLGQNAANQIGQWKFNNGQAMANILGQQGQAAANSINQQGAAWANGINGAVNSLGNAAAQGLGWYALGGGGFNNSLPQNIDKPYGP